MENILSLRILIFAVTLTLLLLSVKLTGAPFKILRISLSLSWIAGLLAALLDLIAVKLHFWHYLPGYLFFGLPPDLYISVSIIAAVLGIIYWYLRKSQSPLVNLFIIIVPGLGFFNDLLGNLLTGNKLPVWDSPYWFLADFTIWTICWGIMIVIYNYFLSDPYRDCMRA